MLLSNLPAALPEFFTSCFNRSSSYQLGKRRVQFATAAALADDDTAAFTASATAPRSPDAPVNDQAASTSSSYTPTYSWIDYWNKVEDNRQFRQQVFLSTRGRQVQRRQYMRDMFGSNNGETQADEGDSSDLEDVIINGRLAIQPEKLHDDKFNLPPIEDDIDELEWLASHPEENEGISTESPSSSWSQLIQSSLPQPVELRIGSSLVPVRPLWIAVFQSEGSSSARLFESVVPLQEEVMKKMSLDLTPFATTSGLQFDSFADVVDGSWRNFFIGLIGDVAVEEHEILWPNQILHKDRVLYNVRNAEDIARFLADPKKEEVESHLENLTRLAAERKYRKGWCWHMLRARWGEQTLQNFGIKTNTPVQTSVEKKHE